MNATLYQVRPMAFSMTTAHTDLAYRKGLHVCNSFDENVLQATDMFTDLLKKIMPIRLLPRQQKAKANRGEAPH